MLTRKRPEPGLDDPQPRTGHGCASVIARLNEQISRAEQSAMEEPDETPLPEAPVATTAPGPLPS